MKEKQTKSLYIATAVIIIILMGIYISGYTSL